MKSGIKWISGGAFFLSLLLLLLVPAMATTWQQTGGPDGAPINALAFDSNSQAIYAGTVNGVFKFADGGPWRAMNNGLGSAQVSSLAIDPNSRQIIYAGTNSGVFKSTDGGASWSKTSTGLTSTYVWALAIDPTNSQTIYAGSGRVYTGDVGGVFKSTDGGGTWTSVNNGLTVTDVSSLAIDPIHPQTIYAGTGSNGGANGNGVYKSTDGGNSWSAINNGLKYYPGFTVVYALAIDPSQSQTIYAGTWWGDKTTSDGGAYTGVYKSTDGGGTWTEVLSAQVSALAIDPIHSQTIYAGTWSGVSKSTDGGSTWSASNNGLTSTNVYSLAIGSNSSDTVYAGTNSGGVFEGLVPSISGTPDSSVIAGNAYSFAPTATHVSSFSIVNKPSWAAFNVATGALTGTPSKANLGTYSNIVITANFNGDTASLPAFSITVILPMPTISGTPATSVTSGDTYSFTPTSTNAASFSISNKPAWATFNTTTGALTGTPTNANAGTYSNIVISATNSTGTASLPAFSITVALPMPAIFGTPATTVTAGSSYSFTPTAANATSFSIVNKPSWASFNSATGALSGTPANADSGTYSNIVVSAVNSTGTASLPAFSITVSLPMPSISGTPATSVTTGNAYSFTPTATNATSFSISNKPPWASFNTTTGALTGTPANADVGIYSNIVIGAINSTGTASLPAFSIAVALPMPSISGTPATSVTAGTPYSFTPAASNATSFSIANKPSWASFNTATGALSGTPANADVGTYSNIVISAINSTGTASLPSFSIAVALPMPSISGTPATSVTAGSPYSFTPAASNATSFSIANKPSWASFNTATGSLTGTPANADVGTYSNIAISAINSTGTASLPAFSIAVALPMPSISGTPATSVTAGSAYGFTPTASNATSFSIANKPSWASFNTATGALTGTPANADAGTYANIVISAVNSTGTASLPAFSITVSLPMPSISGTPATNVTAGDAYSFTPTAANATSFSIGNAPSWASFNTATGALTGTPANSDAGIYSNIVISATNSTGTASLPAFSITVASSAGTGPSLTVSTLPDNTITSNPTLNISGVVTSANGVRGLTINGVAVPVRSDGSFNYAVTLADGANTITIIATDNAGASTTDSRTITLDRTAPTITVTAPADNSITAQSLATITGSISESGTVQVTVNGGGAQSAAMNGTGFSATVNLAAGTNTIVITATDLAGNNSSVKRTITSDTSKPSLAITDPGQDITITQGSYLLKGTADDSTTPLTVTVAVDGQTFTPALTNGSFEQQLTFNIEKQYAVVVTATDQAGNSAVVQRNIVFSSANAPMPSISGTPATSITAGNAYSFTPTATNAASFSVGNKPSWANFDTTTGALTGTPANADAGTYSNIVISATNVTGTASLPAFSIAVSLPMPSISGTPATSVTAGNAYSFTPTATNATSFSVSNKPSWASFNTATGALTGTPANTDVGTYSNIVISAINSTGTASLSAFSIAVSLPMPSISGTPATSVTAGNAYSFTPTATNATGFSIVNKPSWASFNSSTSALTGTPANADAGTYSGIVISATNSTGTASLSAFSITVALPMPSISGTPATSVTAGNAYSFTPTATSAASFSIANKPSWASFNSSTGALTGTPANADAGTYSGIVISATNSTGTASLPTFSITVSLPMPSISGTPATSVTAGSSYSFTPAASNATSFSIGNKPSWASFNTATGALAGTPGNPDAGTYSDIVISAINSTGTASLSAFSITVSLPMPSISGTPATSVTAGNAYSFIPTAASATSFSIANKPSWASFNTATGALSGTPANADAGTYSNIAISAINSTGTASLPAFSITVSLPMPSISGTPADSVTAGNAYSFTPTAINATSFSIANKPSWASFNSSTGALTGIPANADAGTYSNIVISAVNSTGTASLPAFSITVASSAGTGPSLAVSTLPDRSITSNPTLNITGVVTSANGVRGLTINGVAVPVHSDGSFNYAVTLADGANTITIIATDNAGASATDRRTITLDRTAPTITVTAPADNSITAQSSATITGSISESGTVQMAVNGGGAQSAAMNGTGFSATVNLAAGTNTIVITAIDLAGNSTSVKRTITSDTSKPSLAITDPGQDISTTQGSYLVKGTAGDSETLVTVSVSVDGQTFTPAVTNGTFEQQLTFSTEKQYAVVVTATDQAGNSVTAQRNIIYSSPASGPGEMPSISGTPSTSVTAGNAYSFTPTATNAASFSIGNKPSWANFDTATGALTGTPANADVGTYANIVISATNSTGTASLPAFSITVSQVSLPMPSISGTPATSVTAGNAYSFTPMATNAASFSIGSKPSWASFDTTTGALTGTPANADAGTYSNIVISAINSTGTASLPAFSITVASSAGTGPSLAVSTLPDKSVTSSATLNISGVVSSANGVKGLTINGVTVPVNSDGSFNYAVILADGANTITIVATDNAGYSTTDSRTITLDRTAPTVAVTSPADNSITAHSSVTITGTISEPGTVQVAVNGGAPQSAVMNGMDFSATVNLSAGTNTIIITITDSAGNSITVKRTIIFDASKPSLAITDPNQDITVTQDSYLLKGRADSSAGPLTVIVSVDGQTFTPAVTNGTFEQQLTFSSEKQYAVIVTATDQNGNSATVQRNIIYSKPTSGEGAIPSISGTPATSVTAGNAYSFIPTATNATSFGIGNKPSWASFDTATGALTGTPANADAGTYPNIVISAINGTATASLPAFSITVSPVSPVALPMPSISGTPATTVTAGNAYSFTPTATNAASFSIGNKPSWASFDTATGALTGTPANADAGTYSGILISATNSTGTVSLPAFSITVASTGPSLTVSTLSDQSVTSSATLNLSGVVASANGIRDLTINGVEVPVNSDGSFNYALTLADGPNTITIVVTDNAGHSTTDSRTITLDRTAPTFTVTAPADNSISAQPLATITGTISAPGTVQVSVNGGAPQAAVMNGMDFSATVNLAAGTNTIIITVTDSAGKSTSTKRTMIYDTSKPSLAITDPNQDVALTQGWYLLKGTAGDSESLVTVRVTVDGQTFTPAVTNGTFEQQLTFSTEKQYAVVVTATDQAGNSATVQRNIVYSRPVKGDLNGDGKVDIADALMIYQFLTGRLTLSAEERASADVAPLNAATKHPQGDGVVDMADLIIMLRCVIGLVSW